MCPEQRRQRQQQQWWQPKQQQRQLRHRSRPVHDELQLPGRRRVRHLGPRLYLGNLRPPAEAQRWRPDLRAHQRLSLRRLLLGRHLPAPVHYQRHLPGGRSFLLPAAGAMWPLHQQHAVHLRSELRWRKMLAGGGRRWHLQREPLLQQRRLPAFAAGLQHDNWRLWQVQLVAAVQHRLCLQHDQRRVHGRRWGHLGLRPQRLLRRALLRERRLRRRDLQPALRPPGDLRR